MDLPRPSYDRASVSTGVVHFGVGGFHRAHQALFHDRLMNEGKALDWGICGVGVMPADEKMRDVMREQDGEYTLVEKHADGTLDARVIGSITEYLFAPDDPEAVIEKLADPATRIVSLTVTEGGYNLDDGTGEFVEDDPAVAERPRGGRDAEDRVRARDRGAAAPARARHRALHGDVVRQPPGQRHARPHGLHRVRAPARPGARRLGRARGALPQRHGRPHHAGHDGTRTSRRSTSASTSRTAGRSSASRSSSGCSRTRSADGRPPYEDVGVQVVDDVEPYELMKLRLLNASHQAIAYFGYLCGYRLVHDAAQDPLFQDLLARYMDEEATPTLSPVPGVDLDDYKQTLIERFSNPGVRDTVPRLCAESSDRIPKWLLPVVRAQLEVGGRDQALGGDRRELGALRRGRRRGRRGDRDRRPPRREADRDRAAPARRARRLHRQPRPVRRPRRRRALRRGLPDRAALTARARRPRDARGAGRTD